jgi:hypothetical protein
MATAQLLLLLPLLHLEIPVVSVFATRLGTAACVGVGVVQHRYPYRDVRDALIYHGTEVRIHCQILVLGRCDLQEDFLVNDGLELCSLCDDHVTKKQHQLIVVEPEEELCSGDIHGMMKTK